MLKARKVYARACEIILERGTLHSESTEKKPTIENNKVVENFDDFDFSDDDNALATQLSSMLLESTSKPESFNSLPTKSEKVKIDEVAPLLIGLGLLDMYDKVEIAAGSLTCASVVKVR